MNLVVNIMTEHERRYYNSGDIVISVQRLLWSVEDRLDAQSENYCHVLAYTCDMG